MLEALISIEVCELRQADEEIIIIPKTLFHDPWLYEFEELRRSHNSQVCTW